MTQNQGNSAVFLRFESTGGGLLVGLGVGVSSPSPPSPPSSDAATTAAATTASAAFFVSSVASVDSEGSVASVVSVVAGVAFAAVVSEVPGCVSVEVFGALVTTAVSDA